MGPRNYDTGSESQPRFALPAVTSVTKLLLWIISIIGVLVLLVPRIERGSTLGVVYELLSLSPDVWRAWFPWPPLWQLGSYAFLHSDRDWSHLLFNMLGLYFFGTWLEGIVGSRRFLWLFIASIVLGGAVQLTGSLLFNEHAPVVGTSGGVLFLIVAMATLRPHSQIIFVIFPMKLRTLALIAVGLDVFGLVKQIQGTGSSVAVLVHLTGAAFGFAAVKLGWLWFDPLAIWQAHRARSAAQDLRTNEERLDQVLEQIHQRGIGSLTRNEREFLKRMSSRKPG